MKKLHPFDILLLVILAVIVIALIWEVASGKGSTRTIAKLVTLVVSYALYFLRRFAGNPGTRRQLEEAAAPVVGDTFMRDGKLRRKLLDAWAAYNQNQNAKALKMTDSLESQCISPEETEAFVREISLLPGLCVKGLMTVAPFVEDPEENRTVFRKLKQISVDINQKKIDNIYLSELSMGMTNDFEIAIEEGATFVRVGTAIFGHRDYGLTGE